MSQYDFSVDDSHPIPNLDVVDINTVKKGGGSDLSIVVSAPLRADQRSLERLMRKIERYLEFLLTEEFRSESGAATTENTNIVVKLHPGSSPGVFELLEKSKEWVRSNNATLIVDCRLPGVTH